MDTKAKRKGIGRASGKWFGLGGMALLCLGLVACGSDSSEADAGITQASELSVKNATNSCRDNHHSWTCPTKTGLCSWIASRCDANCARMSISQCSANPIECVWDSRNTAVPCQTRIPGSAVGGSRNF